MVLYIEACESGSMFEGLLDDSLNIYVTTASNAHESSWGTYCPGMAPPAPPEFDTCLGDLYSVAWIENRWEFFLQSACMATLIISDSCPRNRLLRPLLPTGQVLQ